MEQLLAGIKNNLAKYASSKKILEETKVMTPAGYRNGKMPPKLFQEKFAAIASQIQAYRDLLYSILRKAAINVVAEDFESSSNYILRLSYPDKSSAFENNIFFAIVAKNSDQYINLTSSNFLAFCGDSETNHINVYAYTEIPRADNKRDLYKRRIKFKEHALHLADDHIDKFNFEEMIPYIERYINNELESIISRSEDAIPRSSD